MLGPCRNCSWIFPTLSPWQQLRHPQLTKLSVCPIVFC
jgi:hypothetical protein